MVVIVFVIVIAIMIIIIPIIKIIVIDTSMLHYKPQTQFLNPPAMHAVRKLAPLPAIIERMATAVASFNLVGEIARMTPRAMPIPARLANPHMA